MLAYEVSDVMPRGYHHRAGVDETRLAGGDNPAMGRLFGTMAERGVVLDATLWVYREMAQQHAAHPDGPAPYCGEPLAERLANQAWRAGVPISAGTDGFSPQADPWPALQDEMELLQEKAGLPPLAVIRSATLVGAMSLHRQAEMGSIAAGKLANLVFVSQDPTKDVRAFRSVVLTVKRGRAFWRKDFAPVRPDEMGPDQE
jgi:imidazolonepropionase-like amidohydrolase